eukprot:7836359-Ditylum_brightwellii.AAC.1
MSYKTGGLMQGMPQSIGPDGQQHHVDDAKKQERAFEITKMVVQDKILKLLSRRKTADQTHEINKYTTSLIKLRRATQAETNK